MVHRTDSGPADDRHAQAHHHGHEQGDHGHTHGVVDPSIATSDRGIWAISWSFVILLITALLQVAIVWLSGSVALLADTIHNFGDAGTSVPLGVAFLLARWAPSQRFSYGYGRVEDLAGLAIVVIIAFSAVVAGYESVQRFLQPQPVSHLWAVAAAAIVGFLGNEAVAVFRIKVGREIDSAALIADGYHARVDGWTSLAVLFSAVGVWLGYPLADPVIGMLITVMIARIVWQSSQAVFTRILDGVDPDIIGEIRHVAGHPRGVRNVTEVRARWLGHRLHAELNVAVDSQLTVAESHAIALEVRHQLLHQLPFLSSVMIHIDPAEAAGEEFHRVPQHTHDGLEPHSHY